MTSTDPGTRAGQRMVAQLSAVHGPLRRDGAALRTSLDELSAAVVDVAAVGARLQGLTIADATWQLTNGCQWFCRTVEGHHDLEEALMFPTVERQFPELKGSVRKLRKQHEDVLFLVLSVVSASKEMDPQHPETIKRTAGLVAELADLLDAHLDLEEETLFPYFLRMDRDWHHG